MLEIVWFHGGNTKISGSLCLPPIIGFKIWARVYFRAIQRRPYFHQDFSPIESRAYFRLDISGFTPRDLFSVLRFKVSNVYCRNSLTNYLVRQLEKAKPSTVACVNLGLNLKSIFLRWTNTILHKSVGFKAFLQQVLIRKQQMPVKKAKFFHADFFPGLLRAGKRLFMIDRSVI